MRPEINQTLAWELVEALIQLHLEEDANGPCWCEALRDESARGHAPECQQARDAFSKVPRW